MRDADTRKVVTAFSSHRIRCDWFWLGHQFACIGNPTSTYLRHTMKPQTISPQHRTDLSHTEDSTQDEIALRVMRRAVGMLSSAPYGSVRKIQCDFQDGVLTLRGEVSSFFFMQVAQTAVARIEGVEQINNEIRVVSDKNARD